MKWALLAFIVLVAPFSFVFADIIYQQPDAVVDSSVAGAAALWVPIATSTNPGGMGLSGTIQSVHLWAAASPQTDTVPRLLINCFTNQALTVACSSAEWPSGFFARVEELTSTPRDVVVTGFPVATFLPERFYRFQFDTDSDNRPLYGTTTPQLCISGCSGVPYMIIEATDTGTTSTETRVKSLVEPQNGTTTYSTSVTFTATWFNNPVDGDFDKFQFEISDVTGGIQYAPVQVDVLVSGNATSTILKNLQSGHYHLWRACFFNTTLFSKRCSAFQSFNVVTASASSSFPVIPDIDETNATSSAQGGIFNFLNIPQLMQTRYPFSYFYAIGALYEELQATSTESIAAVVLDFENLAISTTSKNALPSSWEVFGTSTVTQYIPEAVQTAWRFLMTATVWMGFAYFLYRRITSLFHQTTV